MKEAVTAMTSKMPVTRAIMSVEEQHRSATLFSLLVLLWKRRALLLLQMTEESNGYEAMRKLEQRRPRCCQAGT